MTPEAEAIDWAMRVDDPAFEDWQALEAWLAHAPASAVLFDRACDSIDQAATAMRTSPGVDRLRLVDEAPHCDEPARQPARHWFPPLAIAASLAAIVAVGTALLDHPARPALDHIATRPGEMRTITMGDDSTVVLNGDTEALIGARRVELSRGQAAFSVRHDEEAPFSVVVGETVIRDLGTHFDVRVAPGGTEVAVSEGMVRIEAAGAAVTLGASERAFVANGRAPTAPEPVDAEALSGWQTGRLSFEDSSYAEVVEAVRRRTGLRARLAPGLETRRYAGTFTLNGTSAEIAARLAATLGLRVRHEQAPDGGQWVMEPGATER